MKYNLLYIFLAQNGWKRQGTQKLCALSISTTALWLQLHGFHSLKVVVTKLTGFPVFSFENNSKMDLRALTMRLHSAMHHSATHSIKLAQVPLQKVTDRLSVGVFCILYYPCCLFCKYLDTQWSLMLVVNPLIYAPLCRSLPIRLVPFFFIKQLSTVPQHRHFFVG